MDEGPSRTAFATAYARAYHQIADPPPILSDPLAAPLLGVTSDELVAAGEPTDENPGSGAHSRPRRLFFAARSRFAEDRITATGAQQAVILGAGLDTFAYRNTDSHLRVFEVDHPATQSWKRERLDAAGITRPANLTFVPVDFETDALATQLESAGFSRTDPTVFVWLGVVFYLTPEAMHGTLEYIATQSASTEVVFDYLQPGDTDEDRAQMQERAERVAALGEPWFGYLTPDEIASQLRELGLRVDVDLSATDLIDGYTGGSTFPDGPPRSLRASRILRATTPGRTLR